MGIALGGHELIQNVLDFFQCEVKAGARIGEAQRAIHVAGAVDLDDAHAGVLLVVRAQAAVVGTPVFDLGGELEGNSARLVILD